jgi:hypothetical protein
VKVDQGYDMEKVLNMCIPQFKYYLQMYIIDICYDKGRVRNLSLLKENKLAIEACK